MAETDYNEILLEAIDAIVVSRISEVNFDRTIVATIVDASKAKNGEYVLSDGSVQFTAHSGNDKYKENDRVNVLIPSNDFSSTEKTILGKTSANVNDVPITYVSPLEKIVPMETNYAAGLKGGITANSETKIFQLTNAEWIVVNESTLGYDTLCVSARFKTLLNDYDIRQGHYGLLVQLKTKNGYIHALTLDSAKDMFGNSYGYSMYLTQEQTYHLNLQDNIVGIKIDLYQMKDFKYNDGVNSELQVLPVMPYSNILVDNINVSFGYNAEQVEDNTVKISTADSLTYDNIKDASVAKKLTLTWYNKDENNKYLGFSDGHFAGQDKDNPLYEIKWYHSQNNGEWALLSDFNDATIANVEMNLRWAINEYKAIVTYDGNEYSSNTLSFKAETGYDSNIHDQLNMELELCNGKDSLDSYPFYGADSAVINPGEASQNREIEFVYSGALGSKLESDVLNGAIVSFYIPTISTMLNLPFGSEDEELQKESDLEGYALYQKKFSSYNEDNKQQLKTFRYRVKEFYNPLFNNNTVILKVIDKNGFEYSAKKTFSFSSYGTSGTDYTLVIEDPVNKKATLYDADYKVIKTEFEDKDWSYWPSSIGTGTPTAAAGYAVRKLSTTVKWVGKTVTLEAIKGIPWYPESSNYYYQGPTTITYDSAGVNPRYYTGDIGLYDKTTNEPIVGLTWTLRYYPKNKLIKDPQTSINIQGYSQLLIDESGTKAPKLKAPNMYFDQDYYLVLVANNSNGQAQWRQPLIILQNAHSSNLLNNWNGALSVDQGNNTILSAMIGAGSKDSDNRFSGVVMGGLEKLDANGSIINSEHGLLGFHKGAQSFGLKTDGTAFIGKSGAGRIEFDGNKGIIASNSWVDINGNIKSTLGANETGLKINLADGHLFIDANNSHLYFDNNGLNMQVPDANLVVGGETIGAQIKASADSIKSSVEGYFTDYRGVEDAAGTHNKYFNVIVSDYTGELKDILKLGTLLTITFKKDNDTEDIWKINIKDLGDDVDEDGSYGYPIYHNGAIGSATNPFKWKKDDIITFILEEVDGARSWRIVNNSVQSSIVQTANSITSTVQSAAEGLQSQINQKPDSISLSIDSTKVGKDSGPSITLKYKDANGKETEGGTGTITLDGNVVFTSNLSDGSTVISGNNITTGTISAERIDVTGVISAGQADIKDIVTTTINATSITANNILVKDADKNIILNANSTNKTVSLAGFTVDNNSIFSGSWNPGGAAATIFMSTGTNSKYNICGVNQKDWVLGSGSNFGVDKNGALYSTSGKIGGWDIQPWGIEQLTDDDMLVAGFYSDFTASKRGNFTVGSKTSSDWRLLIYSNFGVTAQGALYATEGEIGPLTIGANGLGFLSGDQGTGSTYITKYRINTGTLKAGHISFDSYGDDAFDILESQALYFGALYGGDIADEQYAVSIGAAGISLYVLDSGNRSRTISWTDFFNKF